MNPLVVAQKEAPDLSHSWPDRRSGATDELNLFLVAFSARGFCIQNLSGGVDRGARVRYIRNPRLSFGLWPMPSLSISVGSKWLTKGLPSP